MDFAPCVKFYCHSCRKLCNIQAVIFLECNFFFTRTFFPTSKNNAIRGISYDVNRRRVMASFVMGNSRGTLVKFASAFDMPRPSQRDSGDKLLFVLDSSLTGVRYAV